MQNLSLIRVEPTWEPSRVRQETASVIGAYKLALWTVLKERPDVLREVQNCVIEDRVRDMQAKGVKTPLDFVCYLAELTVNLGGGVVSYSGNDEEASINYEYLPSWEAMKEQLHLDPQTKEQLLELFDRSLQLFGKALGFSCSTEAPLDRPIARVTVRAASKKPEDAHAT